MNNIFLSKYLFNKAQSSWQLSDDFSNGLTISLLQDSAEHLIWAIIRESEIQFKEGDGFVSLIEKINEKGGGIKLKAQIYELNKARVNFKHYGIIPSTSQISEFIENTKMFLIENSKKLGYDFENISLSDFVEKQSVKELIQKSEKFILNENIEESLILISLAFTEIENDAKESIFSDLPTVEDIWELFPKENQDKARMFFFEIEKFLDEFTHLSALMNLGYSKNKIISIRNRCFVVNISQTGKRLGIHPRTQTEVSRQNVEYLIREITDIAISLYSKA